MDIPSSEDLLDQLDELISMFEQDENRFYVVLDIAHQLRDELSQVVDRDE